MRFEQRSSACSLGVADLTQEPQQVEALTLHTYVTFKLAGRKEYGSNDGKEMETTGKRTIQVNVKMSAEDFDNLEKAARIVARRDSQHLRYHSRTRMPFSKRSPPEKVP